MIHLKRMKPQLSVFNVLVLQDAVVFLLLTNTYAVQSEFIGSAQPIVAMVGDDIILPLHLQNAEDVSDVTVEWARPELDPRFVHVRRDNVEFLIDQNPLYMGRTSVNKNKAKCGDVSLKLSKVKLSDAGIYRCFIPDLHIDSTVQLVVGAVSSPATQISIDNNGVVCKSKGWYPDPELLWLDAEGKILSAGPTETVRGPDDLYTVSSRVTVEKRHSNNITCRVQQRKINQTRETQIKVTDSFFMVPSPSSSTVRIIISLLVCLVAVLIAVLAFWKIKKTEKDQRESELPFSTMESQLLVEGGDRKHHLDMIRAKLEEEKQKAEGELKHVDHIIKTLTVQKKDLKKQREKLNSLLQDVNIKIVENKKKLEDGAFFYEEKKTEKREQTKDDLEKKNKELEEMLKNTETLLERTEGLINTMIERKGKLEKDREQITKQLKQTGRQRDEHQKKLELEQSEREEEKHELKTNESV
ncbi:butyrophilin subfamily 2 member A2-like isoform X2 [Anabas testudineus]|uniref:butyrophilin subfamily 2 member A2-like isoform X2 n=1 Tax=Anabas testudineus TaxID=64144 RepID=UPI000E460BD6|nr:butyrophilin subfamily 2 member A2-like isoform X2 [Anabas testudineus]